MFIVTVFTGNGWVNVERFYDRASAEAKAAAIGGYVIQQ